MRTILRLLPAVAAVCGILGLVKAAEPALRTGRTAPPDSAVTSAIARSGDAEIARLLDQNPAGPKERLEYVQQCERAVALYPLAIRRTEICRRIGDVYFCLGRLQEMETWYRKALAMDPSLQKSTSIGIRLQEYSQIKLERRGKLVSLLVLAGVVGAALRQGVRNRRLFDRRTFLRKGMAFLLLYGLVCGVVLWMDGHVAARWLLGLSTAEAGKLAMITPVIPLNMVDSSQAGRAAVILASGFFPVLVAVFYTSFRRRHSRSFLCVMVLLASGSVWTQFYFSSVYDSVRSGKGFASNGRLYLRDEPEELLLRYPQKALRANPELLESGNEDLKEFLQDHYPDGLKGKRRDSPGGGEDRNAR